MAGRKDLSSIGRTRGEKVSWKKVEKSFHPTFQVASVAGLTEAGRGVLPSMVAHPGVSDPGYRRR
jgi:hypothetical protein